MILDKSYYFSNYDKSELFNNIFSNTENVLDLFEKGHKYLEENIVNQHIQINMAEVLGSITLIGDYSIGEGTKIYPSATIEGPVIIGKNCKIMPGAYVRPGCIIGDNCVIGFNSEVKNSIIQDGAKIASLAFVGDSVLGKSARIGSGVITANRRFDQKNITIRLENGEKIDSNTDFLDVLWEIIQDLELTVSVYQVV